MATAEVEISSFKLEELVIDGIPSDVEEDDEDHTTADATEIKVCS